MKALMKLLLVPAVTFFAMPSIAADKEAVNQENEATHEEAQSSEEQKAEAAAE